MSVAWSSTPAFLRAKEDAGQRLDRAPGGHPASGDAEARTNCSHGTRTSFTGLLGSSWGCEDVESRRIPLLSGIVSVDGAQAVDSVSGRGRHRSPASSRRRIVVDRFTFSPGLSTSSLDALPGVQDGGVVTAAELAAEGRQALVGELAGEVHGDLAGESDLRRAVAGEEIVAASPNSAAVASWIRSTEQRSGRGGRAGRAPPSRAPGVGWLAGREA